MNHLLRTALATGLLLAAAAASAADTGTPVGTWKQIDDVTGQPHSIVRITENDGVLSATIEKIMPTPEELARDGAHPVCGKCTGERQGKPIEGLNIMWGVKRDGEVWDGGQIIDPVSGKVYKVKLSLGDGGSKLNVRGYVGFSLLGRTQTWLRQE
jgi:uncharacterized protein (DUF2147 family)